jgi:hypothetical protein
MFLRLIRFLVYFHNIERLLDCLEFSFSYRREIYGGYAAESMTV